MITFDNICCTKVFSPPSLKKILNSSRPSELPPVRGENVKTFRRDHSLQRQNLFMALLSNALDEIIGNLQLSTSRRHHWGQTAVPSLSSAASIPDPELKGTEEAI